MLIEKLLRCCPEVGTIFVLIRRCRKTNMSAQERLGQLLSSRCFDRLRGMWKDFAMRCRAVEGDVQYPKFGISDADLLSIQQEARIVLHCAATVKFNEHLRVRALISFMFARSHARRDGLLDNEQSF